MSTFMAADLAQRKIPVRVVAIALGFFPSEIVNDPVNGYGNSETEALPNMLSPIPLLRWGKYVFSFIGFIGLYLYTFDCIFLARKNLP